MSLLLAVQGGGTNYTLTGLAGSYSLAGGAATLTKASGTAYTLTGLAGSYSITGGSATLTLYSQPVVEDTPDGYWYKQWAKLHKKKPKLEDVIELVQERPATALAEVKEQVKREYPLIDYREVARNVELQRFIAQQILIALELQRIADDEEDIEILMLL